MATNIESKIHFAQRIDSKSSSSVENFTGPTLKIAKKYAKHRLNTYKKY